MRMQRSQRMQRCGAMVCGDVCEASLRLSCSDARRAFACREASLRLCARRAFACRVRFLMFVGDVVAQWLCSTSEPSGPWIETRGRQMVVEPQWVGAWSGGVQGRASGEFHIGPTLRCNLWNASSSEAHLATRSRTVHPTSPAFSAGHRPWPLASLGLSGGTPRGRSHALARECRRCFHLLPGDVVAQWLCLRLVSAWSVDRNRLAY